MAVKDHLEIWYWFCLLFPYIIILTKGQYTSTMYWPSVIGLSGFFYFIGKYDPVLLYSIIHNDFFEMFISAYSSFIFAVWRNNGSIPLTKNCKIMTGLFFLISYIIYYFFTWFIIYINWPLWFFLVIGIRVIYSLLKKNFFRRGFLFYKDNNLYYYSFGIDRRVDSDDYNNIRLFRMYNNYNGDYGKCSLLVYGYKRFYYCMNFHRFNHLCSQLDEHFAGLIFKPSLTRFAELNRGNILPLIIPLIVLSWFLLNLTLWCYLHYTVIGYGLRYYILFNFLYFFNLYFWCYVRPLDHQLEGGIELGPFYMLMWDFSERLVFYSVPALSCYLSIIFFEKEEISLTGSRSTLSQNQQDELAKKLTVYNNILYILNLAIMDHREFNYRVNNILLVITLIIILVTLLGFLSPTTLSFPFFFIK